LVKTNPRPEKLTLEERADKKLKCCNFPGEATTLLQHLGTLIAEPTRGNQQNADNKALLGKIKTIAERKRAYL